MDFLAMVLHPIVVAMRFILDSYQSIIGSWGLAIMALSVTLTLVLLPLQRLGRKLELKIEARTRIVNGKISALDKTLKGEQRFNRIEEIYQAHRYHPMQQLFSASSIIVLLPVLISAVILFQQHPLLVGKGFSIIADLSKPDGLAWGLNCLPVVMFLVTLVDANSRFSDNKSGYYKFLVLSCVLTVLVYGLPSALVLFWICNNLMSLVFFRMSSPSSEKRIVPTKL